MRRIRRTAYVVSAVLLLSACAAKGKKDTDRPSYSISMKVAEKLGEVRKDADKKDFEGARAKADRILEMEYLNPYERAAALAARSLIHFAQENNEGALTDLEAAVALDAMPMEQQQSATFQLGQAYFINDRFDDSANAFAKWHENAEEAKPEELYVAASAFAQAKRYEEALPLAKRAIEGMNPPTEAQLLFLVSLHFQLKQEQEVATLLKRLTKEFPENKAHWLQLAASYTELGDSENALATLDAAYAKKMLSEENELIELSRLYMAAGKPDKCTEVIERHLGDGTLSKSEATYQRLMMCQIDAKDVDGAGATFAKAGDSIGNAELLLELAKLELARKQWTKARDAAAAAFAAGGMKSTAEAHLLLGIAHHFTKRKDAALASLGEAKKHNVTSKCAEAWMKAAKGKGAAPTCYLSTPVNTAK